MKEIQQVFENRKSLYFTLALSIIYIIPLVIANVPYLDDWGRNLYGHSWQHDGRFIATTLAKLWSLNGSVSSIFPFSLIASALILGITGYIATVLLNIERNNTIKWSSLLIATSPYFLGNIVFQFDCIPMALSLLCIVFPFIYYTNKKKFIASSILGIFLSLGLYQNAAMCFFIVASIFLMKELFNWQWKNFILNFVYTIVSFIIAFAVYSFIVKIFAFPMPDRAKTIFSEPIVEEALAENNDRFLYMINLLLRTGYYKYLVIAVLLCSLVGLLYVCSKQEKKLRLLAIMPLVALILAVDFWLISGANIVLKESYWDARTFCGLSFFLLACVSFQSQFKGIYLKVSRIAIASIVLFSFILMAQFGRVLSYQYQFQSAVTIQLAPHFQDVAIKKLGLIGTLKKAPKNEFTYSKFPLLENLVNSPIGQFSAWSKEILNNYGMLDGVEIIPTNDMVCKGILIEQTRFYNVRKIDAETLVIDFNKNECKANID